MYRKNPPNTGFTLVEILVVITIIGILMGLLLAAFGPVRRSSLNFAITTEINELEGAVEQFKTKFGFFPPSELGDLSFPDTALTPNPHYVLFLNYLRRVAPNHEQVVKDPVLPGDPPNDITEWYDKVGKSFDNDTVLVFWLSGLNRDAQFPLTSSAAVRIPSNAFSVGDDPGKHIFFEFDQSRLENVEDRDNLGFYNGKVMRYLQRKVFERTTTATEVNSTAYVYFNAKTYIDDIDPMNVIPAVYPNSIPLGSSPPGSVNAVYPYRDLDHITSAAPPGYNPPVSPATYDPAYHEWFNPITFQIIAAGVDSDFGKREFGVELVNPVAPNTPDPLNWLSPPQYKFHRDNITNFTGGVLEKHIQ